MGRSLRKTTSWISDAEEVLEFPAISDALAVQTCNSLGQILPVAVAIVPDVWRTESMSKSNSFSPGPTPNTVRASDGSILTVPQGWILLPPGDPGLTLRVKAAGDHFAVSEKVGRKAFSKGVWTSSATVERIRDELETERSTASYAKRKESDVQRREKAQAEYVEDFIGAVVAFLGFHPRHHDLGERLARAVTNHVTPVGSGTVARTKRFPVEQRAEASVIAWMRHQTTSYDDMKIQGVKGKRREVRRMLAQRSHELLAKYRRGDVIVAGCPLMMALPT
jgi:hypothetical protein